MTWRRLFLLGTAAVWLVALGAIVKASLDRLQAPPWGNPLGDSPSLEIVQGSEVGQVFTAPMPGLFAIELVLHRNTVSSGQNITFHLRDDPTSTADLSTSVFSASDVLGDKPRRFEFEPVANSKARSYYFYLDSPASEVGDAIAVGYSATAEMAGSSAYQNGQPVPGNLQFHTYYSPRTREKVGMLLSRMSEGRPYWFGSQSCYAGLAIVYTVVLCLFLLQAARTVLEE
jgi:hypothetical protein